MITSRAAPTIGVVTNPNSRKNRGQEGLAARLQEILGERGLVRETRSPEELGPVLDEFRAEGVRTWVADGGDGSLHWLLNTAAARFGGPEALPTLVSRAVPTNGGTIDFVAHHVGLRGRGEAILRHLVALETRGEAPPLVGVPTVVLRGRTVAGQEVTRLGFAAAVAGVGAGFFAKYYAVPCGGGPRAIVEVIARGIASFAVGAPGLRRVVPARWVAYGEELRGRVQGEVELDGERLPFRELTALNVGAFPIDLGGVVKVFQQARGGQLGVIAGEISDLGMVLSLPRLFRGKPLGARGLVDRPARRVRAWAEPAGPFRPVMDGEFLPPLVELELSPGPSVAVPRFDAR